MEGIGGRRRGHSFHDSDDGNHNHNNNSNVTTANERQLQNSNNNNQQYQHRNQLANEIHFCEMEFLTPQFDHSSASPEPLDLSQLEDDDDEETSEDEESEDLENEIFNRGRSRSRSVHEGDDNVALPAHVHAEQQMKIIEASKSATAVNMQAHGVPAGGGGDSRGGLEIVKGTDNAQIRTGPLQAREVMALKKGLEEATISRNRHHDSEDDEQERLDAEFERMNRSAQSNSYHNNQGSHAHHTSASIAIPTDQPARRVKILLLGDSGVGKSSLILRWTEDRFNPTLVGTVGVNFKMRRVTVGSEPIQVQVWDTAGQEQFHKITQSYYRGANAIMLIYDVCDVQSLGNVEYWIKAIKSHASDSVHVLLVGNKTDLRTAENATRTCSNELGHKVASKFGVPFYECSAKDSVNVNETFMSVVDAIVSADAASASGTSPQKRYSLLEKSEKPSKLFGGILKDKKSIPLKIPSGFGSISGSGSGSGASGGAAGSSSGSSPAATSPASLGAAGSFDSVDGKEKCVIS